jgi:hypothetical protein
MTCEAIYNRLATSPRTEDGQKDKYRRMKLTQNWKSKMEKKTKTTEWNTKKRAVKDMLQQNTSTVSLVSVYKNMANQ